MIGQAEKVLDLYRRLPGPPNTNTLYALASLARAKHETGQKDEAYRLLLETEAAQTSTDSQRGCVACLFKTHGGLLRVDGRFEEALVYLKQALALMTQDLGPTNQAVHEVMGQVAFATQEAGRLDEAEELWRNGLQACERDQGANDPLTDGFRFSLGRLLVKRNRGQAAQPMLEQVVVWRLAMLGTNHISTLDTQCWLAQAYTQQGEIQRAADIYVDIGPRAAAQLPFRTASFVCGESAQFFARHPDREKAKVALTPFQEFLEANPPKSTPEFATLVRVTGATKGWAAAAGLCRQNLDLFPDSREACRDIARWLVQERRIDEAKALYGGLRESFSDKPPTRSEEMEILIESTAASFGWPAAAGFCRKNFELFPDAPLIWLKKAWIFRYVGDEDSFRQVVEKALSLSANVLSTNDQHIPIEIAALGPFRLSPEQVSQLDAMMESLEVALPARPANLQTWGYRAVAQMQLQFGRFEKCLAALEKSALHQTAPESYNLFIKATCLHRLGHAAEARVAFDQAECLMTPLLKETFEEPERFLRTWEIYQQVVMCREAKALLGVK